MPPITFPTRAVFPEPSPQLCVTFFTCVGTGVDGTTDLEHTYTAAVSYLDASLAASASTGTPAADRRLRYELVWVDNGGSADEHGRFIARGAQFEVAQRNPTNEGLFRAVNDAWFRGRGCRAPYVLSLEDDRVPRPDLAVGGGGSHLALAIGLLQHDANVVGVRLKDEWSDGPISQTAAAELGTALPTYTTAAGGLRYMRHCMALTSGYVWGAFSMAAVLYDRARLLHSVGMLMEGGPWDEMAYDYAEGQYAVRVGLAGLCTARPFLEGACSTLDIDNMPLAHAPPPGTPCHQIFIERRAPRERSLERYEWFFHRTELQQESLAMSRREQQQQLEAGGGTAHLT